MQRKFSILLLMFFLLGIFQCVVFSQASCGGEKVFTEKRCAGDEISPEEKELYRIVNEYRAQNNLPQIPISDSLSLVANRHLIDLAVNLKSFTHGWSNCPYDINNEKTWDCVLESPKRLNSGYSGQGFENLYRNKTGSASAALALDTWKKSDLHNSLILNLKIFKDMKFDAFGVAINGQYAALWFGSNQNASQQINKSPVQAGGAGAGITFETAVANLSGNVLFDKASAVFVNEKWAAASADKSIMLRLNGKRDDITEAGLSIKPEKNNQLSQKNRDVFSVFLNNIAPEWSGRENWLNTSLAKIQLNSAQPQIITLGSKVFTINIDAQNNSVLLSMKINKKPAAKLL